MTQIRLECAGDAGEIRKILEFMFAQPAEANIVDRLRADCDGCLSLVADEGRRVVGHTLFSPAVIDTPDGPIEGMGLAPMAVLPEHQQKGIGSALVKRGLYLLGERGCPFVIVVGHPEYYSRFGFEPGGKYGLACQWEGVPDEAFMVLMMDEARMKGVTGVARYREEFDAWDVIRFSIHSA